MVCLPISTESNGCLPMTKKKFTLKREEREVVNERIFDAPCELVWKVYTDPELVPKWWGPKYLTTTVDKMDVRVGGVWRFVQRDQDGKEYAFNGDYREIVPHERLVYTFEFEGMPGHVLIETITFEELDGKTKMTDTAHYQTIEDLDGMLESGMEEGATETMDRLAELVEKSQEKYMNPSELIDKNIAELADAGYADHPFAHRTFQTASSIYLYFKQPSDNMRN